MRRVAPLLLVASGAWASPATPPSLESLVRDSPLIVVARLKTRPALAGDVYEIEVEETLKGAAPDAPVRVRAPDLTGSCVRHAEHRVPAREVGARRAVLFLMEPEEGAFHVRNVTVAL